MVSGLLEPCAGRLASTVLRGLSGSDTARLPGNRQRLHSSLGYASPDSFESAHYRNFNESSQSG
jgi:hypothetical protein